VQARELFDGAASGLADRAAGVADGAWGDPTPCADWDVRALLQHVVSELRWIPPLLDGATVAEVGDRFDGDQLGAVPLDRWHEALRGGLDAAGAPGTMADTVHLSFGDVPGSEYAMQLFADHLVHGWDLAVALGRPAVLDPGDAAAALAWFAEREDAYRAAGMIGPSMPTPPDADAGTRLLAAFGRTGSDPVAVVERFNTAFNRHDVAAVMALMSEDCVFEGTGAPDGQRYVGSAAVCGFWEKFFADEPDAWFDAEETIAAGDRVVVRWRYRWGPDGSGGHVRGVDVFRVADGLVTEKLAYVKG